MIFLLSKWGSRMIGRKAPCGNRCAIIRLGRPVYTLYGLKEDEITLVEESVTGKKK